MEDIAADVERNDSTNEAEKENDEELRGQQKKEDILILEQNQEEEKGEEEEKENNERKAEESEPDLNANAGPGQEEKTIVTAETEQQEAQKEDMKRSSEVAVSPPPDPVQEAQKEDMKRFFEVAASPPPADPVPSTSSSSPPPPKVTRPSRGAFSDEVDVSKQIYHVKWTGWNDTRCPVITQNVNGPCPLLSMANVLLLRGKMSLPNGCEVVSSEQLLENVGKIMSHYYITHFVMLGIGNSQKGPIFEEKLPLQMS
jgi:hypothetical protein